MSLFSRLMVFVSGGLAIADVASDYNVVLSLYNGGNQVYYQLSLGIILVAATIGSVQLYRMSAVTGQSRMVALICCVLNYVQGQWLFAFYHCLGDGDEWEYYSKWFESNTLIEVTLESVPMLLFQSYTLLMLASDPTQVLNGNELSAQMVSIVTSLLMSSKSLFDHIRNYPKAFGFDSFFDVKFLLLSFLFAVSSVFNRAVTIIVAAYAFQGTVFVILGVMAAARFVVFAYQNFRFLNNRVALQSGVWQPFYRGIQYVFVDFYGDSIIAVISLIEVIVINAVAVQQDPQGRLSAIPQYTRLIAPIVIPATIVRVITQGILTYRMNEAAKVKAAADRASDEARKASTAKDAVTVSIAEKDVGKTAKVQTQGQA
ncbi:hypothetical protein MP228_003530 [Amoeboaphelidium protococcarum]|nr:hypothetical protein MP228_003530 [Amoeboaphelidium protococcarum]